VSFLELKFFLNGKEVVLSVSETRRALDILHDDLGIKSVKEGCGEGECGACTVLLDGNAVCSCLLFASDLANKRVLTLESLGDETRLHPIQQAFVETGAIQCGFCTPGMILSVKALLDKYPNPTDEQIKKAIEGNLCRCTGYIKIIEAVKRASEIIKSRNL
jgi:carbon-monoxide dehydrogenase small subunit